jgi:hypothetical protein
MNNHTAKGRRIIIDMEDIIESLHPVKPEAEQIVFIGV